MGDGLYEQTMMTISALEDRRDRDVLLLRLGLEEGGDGKPRPIWRVAELMNTSTDMARAIERRALRRLRELVV